MRELLDTTDEEGYVIELTLFDVEKIARTFRRFNRLQRDLEKRGFEMYMPHYAGTCWNDMEIWADDIQSIKEDFEYEDSEPDFESGNESEELEKETESELESINENPPKRRKVAKPN